MRRLLTCLGLVFALAAPAFAQTTNVVGTKREDTATATSDILFPMGVKRCDTAASTGGTDGDLVYLCSDSTGRLWIVVGAIAAGDNDIGNVDLELAGTAVSATNPVAVRFSDGSSFISPATDVTEDAAETAGGTGPMVMTVRRDTAASSAGTAGDNSTLNTDGLGRTWIRNGGPCADHARVTSAAISESTAATNEIVALNSGDIIYVCSYKFVTTLANSIKWVRGTGSDCGTGTADIEGAQPYAANGGAIENGGGSPLFTVTVSNALCLTQSAATAVGGRITYVRTAAP